MPEFKLTRVEEQEQPQRRVQSTDTGATTRNQTVTSTSTPASTTSTSTQNDHTGFTVAFAIVIRGSAGIPLPGETEPPPLAP